MDYELSNHDINKFISLLRRGAYPQEYIDDWKKFDEKSLPEKEDFYSFLNMEHFAVTDQAQAKGICKDTEMRNLSEYYHLYVESNSQLMYLMTFGICFLKYMGLLQLIFFLHHDKYISQPQK